MIKNIINYVYNTYNGYIEIKCCICSFPFLTDKKNKTSKLYCGIDCYNKDLEKPFQRNQL